MTAEVPRRGTRPARPEVEEAEAVGQIAVLYEAIRSYGPYNAVPLLFRRLAAHPTALAWAWSVLEPGYRSGEIGRWACDLVAERSSVAPIDAPLLDAQGVSGEALEGARRITVSFNAANPKNLISSHILFEAAATRMRPVWSANDEPEPAARAVLPAPMTPALLPPQERGLLEWLSSSGNRDDTDLVPTLYRMLAHWPHLLTLIACRLDPLFAAGDMNRRAAVLRAGASALIQDRQMTQTPRITQADACHVQRTATAFIAKIPEMLVVGGVIDDLLGEADHA